MRYLKKLNQELESVRMKRFKERLIECFKICHALQEGSDELKVACPELKKLVEDQEKLAEGLTRALFFESLRRGCPDVFDDALEEFNQWLKVTRTIH
jgi:hypothetical protein